MQGIAPGTRVRVSSTSIEDQQGTHITNARSWRVGTLREVTGEALVLQPGGEGAAGDAVRIPFESVQEVQVSRGMLSSGAGVRRGILQGAAGGAILGLAFVATKRLGPDCKSNCEDRSPFLSETTGAAIRDVAVGTGLGAVIGGLVGSRSREMWQPVAHHVAWISTPSATGVALSLRF